MEISLMQSVGRTGFAISIGKRALIALMLCAIVSLANAADVVLDAHSFWLGNSTADQHWTQSNITAIAATPDGRVLTNAPWDESGAEVSEYRAGKVTRRASGTHGWGWNGGNAIAVDDRYIYIACFIDSEGGNLKDSQVWPPKGRLWFGISRRLLDDPAAVAPFRADIAASENRNRTLASAFLRINETAEGDYKDVGGLASDGKRLYVSNTAFNRIEIFDRDSMRRIDSWPVVKPGRIAASKDGSLWVITHTGEEKTLLAHLTSAGAPMDDVPRLDAAQKPADVMVDASGRVWIADNGPAQRLIALGRGEHGYEPRAFFGEAQGVLSAPAGRVGAQRFNGLTGMAGDAAGNIYVSTNGVGVQAYRIGAGAGATLEAYAPSGSRLWKAEGLMFVDGGWLDPSRPGSVYTGNKRFSVNLSDPTAFSWEYSAFLSNRFRYPHDPNVTFEPWPGSPIVRLIKGRLFLYLVDMYADHLRIYRFNEKEETAIPSGFIATGRVDAAKVPEAPAGGDWIWRDANGDGSFEKNEFRKSPSSTTLSDGWSWWVDKAGNVWRTNGRGEIVKLALSGIDPHGNPVYAYSSATRYAIPSLFKAVRRAIYDSDKDVMYLTGYTRGAPFDDRYWKEAGRVLARYDTWSTHPVLTYQIELPWDTSIHPPVVSASVAMDGDFVFVSERTGKIHVFDKHTGAKKGVILAKANIGNGVGEIDMPNGLSVQQQSNGEYILFAEEDTHAKLLVYRWKP
jgi:hypothetical protein